MRCRGKALTARKAGILFVAPVNPPPGASILTFERQLISGRRRSVMWTILALFILWILSMYFYMPLPVVVVLFAALASGTAVTVWFALLQRNNRLQSVAERDTTR